MSEINMSNYTENSNFQKIKNTVVDSIPQLESFYNNIADLNTRIDAITFDSNNQLYQFFGTFRYLSGDIIYTTTFSIISLIAAFYLFRLLKRFVNFILSFVPFGNIRLP